MGKFRIQKLSTSVAVAHGATAIFNSASTYAANGILYAVKSKIASSSDASATYTVSIVDSDGDVVYSKAGISGTAGTVVTQLTGDQRAALADDTFTIRITFSANQTVTDNTVTVTLLIDRRT
jgi:hypothetical protein